MQHVPLKTLGFFRRQDSLEAVHRVLHFEFSRCLGGCSWEGMADMLVSKQHVISWESKVPPPKLPPQINKALLRDYENPLISLNKAPSLLGG